MQDLAVVPAVSVPSAHTCLRSLHDRGVGGIVVSERESPAVACSRYCSEFVQVPAPAESVRGYRDALLALAERDDVGTVIPVRDEDIYVLSRYRDSFSEHVGTPWPSFEKLRRVHDRVELFDAAAEADVKPVEAVTEDEMIMDIGPDTAERFAAIIAEAGTVVWNGPVGVFEFDQFGEGTRIIAQAIADSDAFSVAGGGDTLAAIEKYDVADGVSYISTGGGAFLEFLEGKTLPAVAMLEERAADRRSGT